MFAAMHRGMIGIALVAAALATACDSDDGGGASTGSTGGTTGGADTTGNGTQPDPSETQSGTTQVDSTIGTTDAPVTSSTEGAEGTGDSSTSSGDDSSGSTTGAEACVGMSFFATSEGSGKDGGNLGGLEGADGRCQALAETAGQGSCTWRAYLSTSDVDARERIGDGPWENFNGDVIAETTAALHMDGLSNGRPQLIFDEMGNEVPGNEHDILTGSQADGTLLADATCQDWGSNSSEDDAGVGHSDIPNNPNFSPSWVEAHVVAGCAANNLVSTGGSGRLYCFAE